MQNYDLLKKCQFCEISTEPDEDLDCMYVFITCDVCGYYNEFPDYNSPLSEV